MNRIKKENNNRKDNDTRRGYGAIQVEITGVHLTLETTTIKTDLT